MKFLVSCLTLLGLLSSTSAFSAVTPNSNKVLVLVEPSPLTYVSGYANRFQALFRHLDKKDTNFEVVTVDVHTPEKPEEHLGRKVHHTPAVHWPLYSEELGLSVDYKMQIGRIIRRMRPDLIHVSSPGFLMFPALFYSRLFQIPLVSSYHTHIPIYAHAYIPKFMGMRTVADKMAWFCIKFFHSLADATVVTSPQIQQEFIEHSVPKCFLWEKGVDTERFHPKYKSDEMRHRMTDGHPDDFLVVHVGRLGKEKRIKECKEIMEKVPNARLCIVGHGPKDYEKELEEYFEGTNTVFLGLLHGDELSSSYASADAFLMPSDSETLGFVVLESMASEIPVVGCNAGGIPHTIRPVENTGSFLVETGDIDGYAEKLKILQNDPELCKKMGKTAREEMLKWSWEDSMSGIQDQVYEIAKENKRNRPENRLWRFLTLHNLRRRIFGRKGAAQAA